MRGPALEEWWRGSFLSVRPLHQLRWFPSPTFGQGGIYANRSTTSASAAIAFSNSER